MNEKLEHFDVVVVGGGPAGIIAAIRASELGRRVLLIEKNKSLGKKLLITGNGRCNITNASYNLKELTKNYGRGGGFLFHGFSKFGPKEVIEFFEKRGLKTKTERGGRVFPKSDKAQSVLNVLKKELGILGVSVVCSGEVHRFSVKGKEIKKAVLKNKKEIFAENYIIATGGLSYPLTGSSGSGLRWAKTFGHKIEKTSPSLVPFKVKESWAKDLQGLGLKNVNLKVVAEKKGIEKFGECMFTHYGLSGPVPIALSEKVGEFLNKNSTVKVLIDLKPALSFEKLDKRVQRDFNKYSNKEIKNALDDLLPSKIIPVVLMLSRIDLKKKINKVTKEERRRLIKTLKDLPLTVDKLMGFDLAIVTKGGVSLKEIDEKYMRSKKIDNLLFAGEVLDVHGPTGGFNLQACWSTGYLAGEGAAKKHE